MKVARRLYIEHIVFISKTTCNQAPDIIPVKLTGIYGAHITHKGGHSRPNLPA